MLDLDYVSNAFPLVFISFSSDERDRVQKKTFTKWVNKHLIKVCVMEFSWLAMSLFWLYGNGFKGFCFLLNAEHLISSIEIQFIKYDSSQPFSHNPLLHACLK